MNCRPSKVNSFPTALIYHYVLMFQARAKALTHVESKVCSFDMRTFTTLPKSQEFLIYGLRRWADFPKRRTQHLRNTAAITCFFGWSTEVLLRHTPPGAGSRRWRRRALPQDRATTCRYWLVRDNFDCSVKASKLFHKHRKHFLNSALSLSFSQSLESSRTFISSLNLG